MAEIEGEVGAAPAQNRLQFLQLDLASLHATKAAAEEFARREERVGRPKCVSVPLTPPPPFFKKDFFSDFCVSNASQ